MKPVIINARWTIDGISVPYTDHFSVLIFIAYLKHISMHIPLTTAPLNSFKSRSAEVKQKFNHKFKNL